MNYNNKWYGPRYTREYKLLNNTYDFFVGIINLFTSISLLIIFIMIISAIIDLYIRLPITIV